MAGCKTEDEIHDLLSTLGDFSVADSEDIRRFVYHGEYECAMHLLVGTARIRACPISETTFVEIERLATKVAMANPEWLSELKVVPDSENSRTRR